MVESRFFTFISNRQKGLKLALSHVLPDCEQRSCVRHVYANFKTKFPGLFMKQKLWAAARATTVEEFNRHMAKLKEANVLAFQWLSANPISEWSMCAFREGPRCDILLNNLCESFNSTIVEAASHWVNPVGPRIVKIVEKNKAVARLCHEKWAGGFIFQVTTCTQDQLVVNLSDGCCSCRQFQLSGIPCGHALACIYSKNLNVYDYVDSFYKKESYEKTYGPIIYPMPHPDRWPNVRQNVILPPLFKQMPRRPKKERRREASEPPAANESRTKARRFNMVMHCQNCKQLGHYYSGCNEELQYTHLENQGQSRELKWPPQVLSHLHQE
ncbi:hypothetical protein UlMin_010750 [Ulmus minor]